MRREQWHKLHRQLAEIDITFEQMPQAQQLSQIRSIGRIPAAFQSFVGLCHVELLMAKKV